MNNAVMMKHHDANRDELVRCLEIAWKNNSGYKKNIDVKFPLRWLLTGGVDVSLSLYNGRRDYAQ